MWGNPHHNSEALSVPLLPTRQDLRVLVTIFSNCFESCFERDLMPARDGDAFRQFWKYVNLAADGLCTRRLKGCTKTAAPNSKTCRSCGKKHAERHRKRRAARAPASELAPNLSREEAPPPRGEPPPPTMTGTDGTPGSRRPFQGPAWLADLPHTATRKPSTGRVLASEKWETDLKD